MRPLACTFLLLAAAAAREADVDDARKFIAQSDYPRAVAILRERLRVAPQDVDAQILLGTVLALEDKRSESIAAMTEAVRLAPESAMASNALGSVLAKFAEMQAARLAFARAVELDGNFAQARINLALLLAQEQDATGALAQLDRVIAMHGSKAELAYPLYLRGKLYSESKDFSRAIPDLEKATAANPAFADAWSALGVARKAAGQEAPALLAFQQASRRAADDADVQYRLGAQYLAVGRAHEAVTPLRLAMRLKPDSQPILYSLGRALRKDGQTAEAARIQAELRALLQKSKERNASNLLAVQLNSTGVELEKTGNLSAAIAKYQEALDLDPTHDGFRMNYGLALCRAGRWQQGISELQDVSERNPDNAEAARALHIATEQAHAKAPR